MSKLMYSRQDPNNHNTHFLSGIVEKITFPDDNSKRPAVVTVKTRAKNESTWEDISIDLHAWDKRADNLKNMKFSVGSYAVFRIGDIVEYTSNNNNETILQAPFWGAMYTGYWDVDDVNQPELLILSGRPEEITENNDGSAFIVLKSRSFQDGQRIDILFNLNIKANTYSNMISAGFNKYCSVVAIGTMINDDTMDVGRIDFYNKPKPFNAKGRSGKYNNSRSNNQTSSRRWGGTANNSFDE